VEALKGFCRDERGMVPYSLLGITMLLIVGVAVYHFNNMDILKAQERNSLTFDMETFYSTVKIGQDLHDVARTSAEKAILEHSMSTYASPIDVNAEWGTETAFGEWKNNLADDISEEAKKEIYNFYYHGNQSALEKQYYNPSTDFDFSKFIFQDNIEVSVTQDNYDHSSKIQKSLELKVGFKDGGVVNSKNRFTGYELSMGTGTVVSVDSRPFTMADKVYDFTEMFNKNESADELAWYLWGMQEVLGLLEANVKHNVKFATDDRVSYSLMHLIIAYKELEHFGTFDYVHTTLEFLRPWMGSEGEATEFLSLFQESVEGGYVDQAIESMGAAIFVRNVANRTQDVSDSMVLASSYIDSGTVTVDGGGFNSSEVAGLQLSGEGTVQHLERVEDTQKLTDVRKAIESTKKDVVKAKTNVRDSTINSLSIKSQLAPLKTEWDEVRGEWNKAKKDFTTSQHAITSARDDYSSLSLYIDGEKCNNPIAAMLWFGDSNQRVKGLRKILPAKVNETEELLDYYLNLEEALDELNYESVSDSYKIDKYHENAKNSLNEAEVSMQKARAARDEYLDQKYKYDHCYRHVDWRDSKMENCLGSGYSCKPYDCHPYDCNCVTETDEEGNSATSCDTCYETCYHECYDCICDKNVLKVNYQRADAEYRGHMISAEEYLATAAMEVLSLQEQIDAFFNDKGIENVYKKIDSPILPSISYSYYRHWNYTPCQDDIPFPGKKYNCAKTLVPDPSPDINETNYDEKMPKSPLTYDDAHEYYSNYGLYYLKYVIDKMDETFGGESLNQTTLENGKDALEDMKDNGFFKKIHAILKPVKKLVDTAGDVKSAIAMIKNADENFPNINEHFYTTLPLPPFNGSKIGFENQGFTVIHDIRLRADTRPGKIKLPIVGDVSLGRDNAVNPSLPIPYTPINVYLWGFDIGPSKVGTKKEGVSEPSTLWLIDIESNKIAPLMEIKSDNENVQVPLYLHKPVMYKYEFTPNETISKGLDNLPPVFILSLGPFSTRFGSHMEPPDKDITDNPLAIDVAFDREFANDSAVLAVSAKSGDISVKTYITEVVSSSSFSISDEDEKEIKKTILKDDLTLLDEYGWSEVRADAYATDGSASDVTKENIKGEDHARVYFIDSSLTSVGIKLENDGSKLKVINTGNKKVGVAIGTIPESGCVFILYDGGMAKTWIGTVGPDAPVNLTIISDRNTKITARVLMPEKVKDKLEKNGIPLTLKDEI